MNELIRAMEAAGWTITHETAGTATFSKADACVEIWAEGHEMLCRVTRLAERSILRVWEMPAEVVEVAS